MTSRLKFIVFIGIIAFVSLQYSSYATRGVVDTSNTFVKSYLGFQNYIKDNILTHFAQQEKLNKLREENKKLERSNLLLSTFAGKLNRLLEINQQKPYNPKLQLVEALSYEQISNYNRIWINMNDFNTSKIYGLIYNGSTAGIVISKNKLPLALLQGDNKCVFSVTIGNEKMPGVAVGKGKFIHVKYIPSWMEPKIGDEVFTSGLDNIFPIGIPVGIVTEVIEEEAYRSAIIAPHVKSKTPAFFYVIK